MRIELSIKKGELYRNGKELHPKIIVPKATDLLKLKSDEVTELNKIDIRAGPPVNIETSTFQGYVSDVSSFNEVNHAYEYVRFHNMRARHIVCAARVPREHTIDREDYADDDEHDAGMRLLNYMIDSNIKC